MDSVIGDNPLVSVLVTAYNRVNFIPEAIESILASDYEKMEIIIVDDCSVDETMTVAKSYEKIDPRIKVYQNQTNLGDYHNRNKAASYATGKYLKYVDSDDTIKPYCLTKMVKVMEEHPDVAIAVSSRYEEDKKDMVNIFTPEQSYKQHFFIRNLLDYGPSGVIIRKSVFDEFNGFSGKRNISDVELWLRIASRYNIAEIEPGLVFWREHEGQEIRVANEIYLEYSFNVLKEALNNKYCPLNPKQKKFIIAREKKMTLLNIFKYSLKTMDIGKLLKLLKLNKLSLADLFLTPYLMVTTSPRIFPNINKKYLSA